MALMKSCNYGGCRVLVVYGTNYCDKHKVEIAAEHKQDYKNYKARRTDKREEAFYNTKSWDIVKDIAKSKTVYIDVYEYYIEGNIVQGDTVHHIVCVKDSWDSRLDTNNLIYLTLESHAIVHAKYNKSAKSKADTQRLLFNLKDRFEKEFNN